MPDAKESIGQQIKAARMSKEMTQQELSDKLGITRHQIAKYENGRSNLTIETIEKLSTVLGVTFTISPET